MERTSRTTRTMGDAAVRTGLVLAAGLTAGIHVYLAIEPTTPTLRVAFVVGVAGFLAGIALILGPSLLGRWTRPLGWTALVGTAVATIVGYFVVNGAELYGALPIVAIASEAAVIILAPADAALSNRGHPADPRRPEVERPAA